MRKTVIKAGLTVLVSLVFIFCLSIVGSVAERPEVDFEFQVEPLEIPMSDGAKLAGDLYIPFKGKAYPVILIMTPYNKNYFKRAVNKFQPNADLRTSFLMSGDYVIVVVDWRGRFASRRNRLRRGRNPTGQDGYDTVEWIAKQPWCSGKIGMWGHSALGNIQYHTAVMQPPHLTAIIPGVADPVPVYEKVRPGGVMWYEYVRRLGQIGWVRYAKRIEDHPLDDGAFKQPDPKTSKSIKDIQVPVMVVGGWFDINEVTRLFQDLRSNSHEKVRKSHRLIMGPWTHQGALKDINQGEMRFKGAAAFVKNQQKAFFDYWLRGIENEAKDAPAVLYHLIGKNEWRASRSWPPPGAQSRPLYLHKGGHLAWTSPLAGKTTAIFISDPQNPVPTVGGSNFDKFLGNGPQDQSKMVETHKDVLIYTSDVLPENLEIAGDIKVRLFISSDSQDTDVAFRLTDVYPDGRSMLLRDGILRMSLSLTFKQYNYLTPGKIYEAIIKTYPLGAVFLKGHRIRLIISSSNYSRYELNTNARKDESGPPQVAINTLYHDAEHPSALILPVLPR